MTITQPTLLEAKGLTKRFPIRSGVLNRVTGHVHSVSDLSFSVGQGETLGLVGESGCGKSTTGRLLGRLLTPTEGTICFEGTEYTAMNRRQTKHFPRAVQMVFQDPYGSLSPRLTIGELLEEPLIVGRFPAAERQRRVAEIMDRVGLAQSFLDRYPAQFSGGQRQRINIARALTLKPKLIVLDEPVSALDVSIQAQIVNLLADLRDEYGLAFVFIAHDLSVVKHLSHRVAVMYMGRIVEIGSRNAVFTMPTHPYTRGLLSAVPVPDPEKRSLTSCPPLTGELPSPANPPSGCVFRTRCPIARDICAAVVPPLAVATSGAEVACHYPEESVRNIPVRGVAFPNQATTAIRSMNGRDASEHEDET